MPNYTTNLNLEKPLQSEQYNVDVFNANADKIDQFAGQVPARALTADKLTTGAKINGVNFKGNQDIITGLGLHDSTVTYNPPNLAYKIIDDEVIVKRCLNNNTVGDNFNDDTKWEEEFSQSANKDLSNLSATGEKHFLNKTQITNCITEIPQDIKLELSNGTLTLKAGSKVYVPNGSGIYNTITTSSDITSTMTLWGVTQYFAVLRWGNNLQFISVGSISSGSTAPALNNGHWWYDTANNKIKSCDGTSWNEENVSLPLALVTSTNGTSVATIDQVFNGFGYIGSTVFALPNVRYLISNGRNEDGTLNNIDYTRAGVSISTLSSNANGSYLVRCVNGDYIDIQSAENVYNQEDKPTSLGWWYKPSTNYWYQTDLLPNSQDDIFPVSLNAESGKITSFNLKLPFRALDYNDKPTISGWSLPSERYIDLTLGASETTYTAPANGWVQFTHQVKNGTLYLALIYPNADSLCSKSTNLTSTATVLDVYLPVLKGETFKVCYTGTLSDNSANRLQFVYAQGSEMEAS